MKKRIYIVFILSLLIFNTAFSQKAKIKNAVKQYEKLSYANSKEELLGLANQENVSFEILENLANSYYYNNEMKDASKWYKKLLKLNPETASENYFRYAHALKAEKKYEEADKVLQRFSAINSNDYRAKEFLSNTDYLNKLNELSQDFELNNLDINTALSDFGTSVFNEKLIFASSRDKKGKIYKWNGQPFLNLFEKDSIGNITEIGGDINTKYHESSTAFTKDGNTVYFTRNNYLNGKFEKNSDGFHTLKIYKASLINGEWKNIEALSFNSDEYNVAHPALSVDGDKLYFASDMPGTIGGSDIFVVEINEAGTYGEPVNLGDKINTEGKENFPFVSDKGILYFSSNGHLGLGGLDVFKIEINKIGKSETIQNLGSPINSSNDDFGFIVNEVSRQGYISSNRAGGKGDDDIYSFVLPEDSKNISGVVIDKDTQEVISNANIFVNDSDNKIIETLKTDDSGKFKFKLKCNDDTYLIEAKKEGYKDDFIDFSINTREAIALKLELKKKPEAAVVGTDLFKLLNLNPIYFDYDKSDIRPDAEIELQKIIDYLKQFPNVKVDVRSHTDSRGRDAYNLTLSSRRNKSTKAYVINKGGIEANRITGKGYGETQLTNKCSNGVKCSKEEHQANRRSEFIVVAN
ncbi:OmpA family protein [Thalassobellus citreus]|uniref:OmpA family protein n=1 Tax=Thalassobellus citreus TaxID=3367752 RepID=UPI0037AD335E